MSGSYPAFISYHNHNNCFSYAKNIDPFSPKPSLVGNWFDTNTRLGCYRIRSCEDTQLSLVVVVYGRAPFSHVFINGNLAQMAGFDEGVEVILEPVHPASCTAVEIAPLTPQDFEIMDKASSTVEEQFLEQITVVHRGMVFPFWVSPGVHASFKIVRIHPETSQPVFLTDSSELHIAPVAHAPLPLTRAERKNSSGQRDRVESVFNSLLSSLPVGVIGASSTTTSSLLLRRLPRQFAEKHKVLTQAAHPSIIYTLNKGEHYTSFDVVSVQRNSSSHPERNFAILIQNPDHDMHTEGVAKAVAALLKYRRGHFITSSTLYPDYTKIVCSSADQRKMHALSYVDVVVSKEDHTLLSSADDSKTLARSLQSTSSVYPILMTHDGLAHTVTIQEHVFSIHLKPSTVDMTKLKFRKEDTCFLINEETKIAIKIAKEVEKQKNEKEKTDSEDANPTNYGSLKTPPLLQLECQSVILRDLVQWVEYQHRPATAFSGHCLLLGREGEGKTSITTRLSRRIAKGAACVFVTRIDCSSWKGKQADSIEKLISTELGRLRERSPSLLVLDGIDFIHVSGEEEHRQVPIERIFIMLFRVLLSSRVPIVATAKKLLSLHKSLVSQGGRRLFGHTIEMPLLSKADRSSVLHELLESGCDVTLAAEGSDNFSLGDVRRLATRITIEARIRGSATPSPDDVTKALSHSKPAGSVERRTTDRKWTLSDVGGMEKEKQLMTEVLLWPTKYSSLYESCGIRLGRGVLLHGPSGCGKTLLANAFAQHTGFNIISVKGPELLSKYIGSSEENVRQVFERARASAPCVVVFDELDSLAPCRGSDSTGVTDRVVNQLLTEMDGAEGLQGVFVIGCTSRMDMIDPALLRPGRFDHIVKCNPPNDRDRAAIVRVVLRDVAHSKDVSPTAISLETNGWTGADLRALITNAQFNAVRMAPKDANVDDVIVTMRDVEAVMDDTRPKERQLQKEAFRAGQRVHTRLAKLVNVVP